MRVIGIQAEGSTTAVSTNATAMEIKEAIYFANKVISRGECYSTFFPNIEKYLAKKGKVVEIYEEEVYDGDDQSCPDSLTDEGLMESLLKEAMLELEE